MSAHAHPGLAALSYSVETAALVTGETPDEIRRAIRAGDLPTVKSRKDRSLRLILADDLAAWVASFQPAA